MAWYPLLFESLFQQYIWGGRKLEKYEKHLPDGRVAESWELAAHADGTSIIANGVYKGMPLTTLCESHTQDVLGTGLVEQGLSHFPLLIKFIDANDRLSVQVHPSDGYAKEVEHSDAGKTEMWIVLEAEPDAEIIFDLLPGITKEILEESVLSGDVESCLQHLKVKPGDVFFIPAGKVHAIGAGIVLAEIQQNSNLTYRVHDYHRVDASGQARQLHIQKALEVIDCSGDGTSVVDAAQCRFDGPGYTREVLAACTYFVTERLHIKTGLGAIADGSRFHALVVVAGSCLLQWQDGQQSIVHGQTILIPGAMGAYQLTGEAEILAAYLPSPSDACLQNAFETHASMLSCRQCAMEQNALQLTSLGKG